MQEIQNEKCWELCVDRVPQYKDHVNERKLTDGLKLRVFLNNLELVEQRDEWLVSGLNEHKLKGVVVEGNAFQGLEDCVKHGATGN